MGNPQRLYPDGVVDSEAYAERKIPGLTAYKNVSKRLRNSLHSYESMRGLLVTVRLHIKLR